MIHALINIVVINELRIRGFLKAPWANNRTVNKPNNPNNPPLRPTPTIFPSPINTNKLPTIMDKHKVKIDLEEDDDEEIFDEEDFEETEESEDEEELEDESIEVTDDEIDLDDGIEDLSIVTDEELEEEM